MTEDRSSSSTAAPSPFVFDPVRVTRVVFRLSKSELAPGETLGPNYDPRGRYVFASDYDHLLRLYLELKARAR